MDVALKVLYSNVDYELIKKETSIQRQVCHKNILRLYGVSHFQKENQTQYVLVLELADYSLDIVTQTSTKMYLSFDLPPSQTEQRAEKADLDRDCAGHRVDAHVRVHSSRSQDKQHSDQERTPAHCRLRTLARAPEQE